jgi:hypothetical protein
MRIPSTVVLSIIFRACNPAKSGTSQAVPAGNAQPYCGTTGASFTRTTLYFGLTRPSGRIGEGQWRAFLSKKVTPRFTDGLTVWEADGQWRGSDGRINRERAKVLLLVHSENPQVRAALSAIIADYKHDFQQESVLWESAPVCAAF